MFTRETFQFNRGVPNCQATGEGLTTVQHSYISDDTIAAITAPGYFPSHFNEEESFVITGDTLLINGSDYIVLVEILDTTVVTLGVDLFTSGTGSILHAPFTVIAGDDIDPIPVLNFNGITVRGDDPTIGYVAIGGDNTQMMVYGFATSSLGPVGATVMSPVGFIGALPEIGIFNIYDMMTITGLVIDSTGVLSVLGSFAVDAINEFTASNGTDVNGVNIKATTITFADSNVYIDNGVSLANKIKFNFSTSNNDYLHYDKLTRTFAYATGGVDQITISPTETIIANLTISDASINVDTISEFTPANGITMTNLVTAQAGINTDTINESTPASGITMSHVVKGLAAIQSDVGFDTITAVPFLIGATNATQITFPSKHIANFMSANTNNNIAIGANILTVNTTGSESVGIGISALAATTTGNDDIAIGTNALAANTTGSHNIAIAKNTLAANTIGSNNIAIAFGALNSNINGNNNIAIAPNALRLNISGSSNIGIGSNALESNAISDNNIAIGESALQFNTTGNNVVIGVNAAVILLTGVSNLILGNQAGSAYTGAESTNILLSNAGVLGESNAIHIGTVGTHTTNFQAGIYGETVAASLPVLIGPTGQMGTILSLRSKKEDIVFIYNEEYSEVIKKLQPVKFNYIGAHEKYQKLGLIADDVEKICPELCAYNEKDELQTVHYDKLGIMLLKEVQRLQEKVNLLENKICL